MSYRVLEFEALIRRLSRAQRAVLDAIAINDDRGHHPRTCEALARKGLIVMRPEVLPGRFPITIKRYDMPLLAHMAWCNVGSDEFDAMTPFEQAETMRADNQPCQPKDKEPTRDISK